MAVNFVYSLSNILAERTYPYRNLLVGSDVRGSLLKERLVWRQPNRLRGEGAIGHDKCT
jgi:hypothetical protein